MKASPDRLITLTFDADDFAVFRAEIARREDDYEPRITSKSCLRAACIAALIREMNALRNRGADTPETIVVDTAEASGFVAWILGRPLVTSGRTPSEALGNLVIRNEACLGLEILRNDLNQDSDESA